MKRYVKSSWNGIFNPVFIMKHSNIADKEEAKKLSDYIYQNEYDSGFSSKEEWLESFDFDDIYKEMVDLRNQKSSRNSHYKAFDIDYIPSDSSDMRIKNLVTAVISSEGAYPDEVEIEHLGENEDGEEVDRLSISYSWGSDVEWPDVKSRVINLLEDDLGCSYITDYSRV